MRKAQPEKPKGDPLMTETRKPNCPSHTLFMVEGEKDNAVWTEIGAVWAHAKGNGFNLSLKAIPYARDARLVILPRKAKEQSTAEAGA
jgi:hypothetical protein